MDYTNRFDGRGEVYAKARPRYAEGLFEYLKSEVGAAAGSVFADVGSGTGIFAEQLLNSGYAVFAVEPNGDMRRKAEEKLAQRKDFVSVNGNDGHTGLPDRSIDFVSAAQAFHWFAPEAFRGECRRILRPGGTVVIVYNFRDENAPCTRALAALQQRFNPAFPGFSNGMSRERCRAFFDGPCAVYCADNAQRYDRQGYIDRVLSSSYSRRPGDEGFEEYRRGICEIFDEFAADGWITVPTDTVAFIGEA